MSAGAGSVPTPTSSSTATGVNVVVPEATLNEFKALKTRRKYRWIVFRIEESTLELQVEKAGAPSSTGRDLIKALPISEARYAVFDFEYTTKDGRRTSKLVFIVWTPSIGKTGMLYASQRRNLDNSITGIGLDVQAGDSAKIAKVLELDKDDESEEEWDPDA
jgi:cofilin